MTVFDNELEDMTQAAVPAVRETFGLDAIVKEFPYGTGAGTYRTDIAGVVYDDDALDRRQSLGIEAALNTKWRYLKAYIRMRIMTAPEEASSKDVLMARVDPTEKLTRDDWRHKSAYRSWKKNWDWLRDNGFLRMDDTEVDMLGCLVVPAQPVDVPLHGEQWAIELKPRDWEKALEQATRATYGRDPERYWERRRDPEWGEDDDTPVQIHGGYADRCVVVMDADHVDAALEAEDQFRDQRVGLASLDRDGLAVHIEAEKREPHRWSRNRLDLNERTLPERLQ